MYKYNCLYDYRNLMTDIKTIRQESSGGPVPQEVTYWTVYKYDEAGNRVRKSIYKYTGSQPDPVYEDGGDNPQWQTVSDEYYVRDISGKEIAIYSSTNLQFWNIWGLDNVGKINSDTTKNYYLKDHLGSIHAVINSTNTVISGQDYDAWGYLLPDRSYNLTDMKYDYTSKERDTETNYDYFGARYYDSRIANWTSIDPLFEKHISFTPYNYVLRNPLRLIDPDGKQIQVIAGLAAAAEAAIITAGVVVGVYTAYEGGKYLAEKYLEQQQSTEISTEITQEKVEITDDPNITNPNLESQTKENQVKGQIKHIGKHLNKIEGKDPRYPNPSDQDKKGQEKL
jgi:RHS repeat-associated protein